MSEAGLVLCRCEMIRVAQVDEAIAEGNVTVNEVKRRTRAGMGICQGAYCTAAIAGRLIASGIAPEHIDPMTARPPTRLVPLAVAAAEPERAG
ncbi:MAG: (2Fe-2S)-binding protein [Chloroflexota bacterium]|jgi:bacterioferritin-associated ferredoxin|nr:(2Fe-2S)-binding protein [Chloroflexota bacterium]